MKIVTLVKFIPDVENFKYDYEKNVLIRENVKMVLNPDDSCALAYAIKLKEKRPDVEIEVVTMAPLSILELVKDLIRRKIDKATVISDGLFVGSDTYVTSTILARYLKSIKYDLILSGSHSLDGDTGHVPSQIADILGLCQLSNVKKIEELTLSDDNFKENRAVVEVENEDQILKFEIKMPCVLSIIKDSKYKLPFVKYADLKLNVDNKLLVISNHDLCFLKEEVGIIGSPTKVVTTFMKDPLKKEHIITDTSEDGMEIVYNFLRSKGFV